MGPLPHRRPGDAPDGFTDDVDLERFADWITEDVLRGLCASHQDLAIAAFAASDGDLGVEGVRAQLLQVIGALRDLVRELRTEGGVRPSPREVERLADAVAAHCEHARSLIAECVQSCG